MHRKIALLLLIAAAAAPAHAVLVRGLYEARVPVSGQDAQQREQALQQALAAVLVRVTGTRHLPAGSSAVLGRANGLVQGYGYESAPGQGLMLKAQFDARAVDALLRQQGLPVWGPNRLTHQVWLALRDDGQPRAIVGKATAPDRAAALIATAEARGVPVSFPDLDATDRELVNFDELWNGDIAGVRGALQRYRVGRVVIGRVGREGGQWLARWTLLDTAELSEEWTVTGASLDEALAEGMHQLAEREGRRFATHPGTGRDLQLQVMDVTSLQDYGRVLTYLRGLNPVRSAQVEAAQDSTVTFRLQVEGDPDALMRAIAAGRVLRKQQGGLFELANRYVLVR